MKVIQTITFTTILFVPLAWAGSINYEIREVASNIILAAGERIYTPDDLSVTPYKAQDQWVSDILVELEQGFKIGARVLAEAELSGFGLIAELEEGDFSWEWFDHEIGDTFSKRQGYGRVRIKTAGLPGLQQLSTVTFLSEVDLCFRHKYAYEKVEEDTHCIKVFEDSVLTLE